MSLDTLENWTSTKTLPSMNGCLCHYSPGVPGFWLREAAASSQATIESTVNCLPTSPYIWSWVSQLSGKKLCPWRMSNCEGILFSHVDDVTLVTQFSGPHFIQDLVFYIYTLWYSKQIPQNYRSTPNILNVLDLHLSHYPTIVFLGIYQRKSRSTQKLHSNVHNSFIYISTDE